jgi:hypothetical protein
LLHSTHPTSDAVDLLMLATETDLQQVLQQQILPLLAAPNPKEVCDFEKKKSWRFCAKCGHWLTWHDTSSHKDYPPSNSTANKHPKTGHKPSFKSSTPHTKVSAVVLVQGLVGMLYAPKVTSSSLTLPTKKNALAECYIGITTTKECIILLHAMS